MTLFVIFFFAACSQWQVLSLESTPVKKNGRHFKSLNFDVSLTELSADSVEVRIVMKLVNASILRIGCPTACILDKHGNEVVEFIPHVHYDVDRSIHAVSYKIDKRFLEKSYITIPVFSIEKERYEGVLKELEDKENKTMGLILREKEGTEERKILEKRLDDLMDETSALSKGFRNKFGRMPLGIPSFIVELKDWLTIKKPKHQKESPVNTNSSKKPNNDPDIGAHRLPVQSF